jgi:hypothetical protein
MKRSHSAAQKRGPNVQDCIDRPRTLQHPLRPADGHHRPPPDRQRPHRHPQRRPPPFRSLRPLRRRPGCIFTFDYFRFPPRLKAPVFRGLFFCDGQTPIRPSPWLRQISRGHAPAALFICSLGISHTKMPASVPDQSRANGRMGAGFTAPRQSGRQFDRCHARADALVHSSDLSERRGCCTIRTGLQLRLQL